MRDLSEATEVLALTSKAKVWPTGVLTKTCIAYSRTDGLEPAGKVMDMEY
jgi:hypothetical protein